MDRTPSESRRSAKEKALATAAAATAAMDDDEAEGEEEREEEIIRPPPPLPFPQTVRMRGAAVGGSSGVTYPICQAEECTADLTEAKRYHRRHKVCEAHAKAAAVVVAGLRQRFCQQCSSINYLKKFLKVRGPNFLNCEELNVKFYVTMNCWFHELPEFDEAKRSCRRRLAGHNERRRKSSSETQGEGSNHCMQADQGGKVTIGLPENTNYKHFQIR